MGARSCQADAACPVAPTHLVWASRSPLEVCESHIVIGRKIVGQDDVGTINVRRYVGDVAGVLMDAQLAQDAANGDSNDSEIDLLRTALESALAALGLTLPAPIDVEGDED